MLTEYELNENTNKNFNRAYILQHKVVGFSARNL